VCDFNVHTCEDLPIAVFRIEKVPLEVAPGALPPLLPSLHAFIIPSISIHFSCSRAPMPMGQLGPRCTYTLSENQIRLINIPAQPIPHAHTSTYQPSPTQFLPPLTSPPTPPHPIPPLPLKPTKNHNAQPNHNNAPSHPLRNNHPHPLPLPLHPRLRHPPPHQHKRLPRRRMDLPLDTPIPTLPTTNRGDSDSIACSSALFPRFPAHILPCPVLEPTPPLFSAWEWRGGDGVGGS